MTTAHDTGAHDEISASHTVLVTGASSGIGEAIARRFVAEGSRVILAARRADRLDAIASELGSLALARALDVTDAKAVRDLVASLPEPFSRITVLVNNAGAAFGIAPGHEASLDDWKAMVDLNVSGLLHVTHAVLPGMVARDRGHVINLGSVAGSYPYAGGNVYGATKAFVEQFSLNLRADLLGKRVRVTNIEPGMVETEFSVVRFKGDADRAKSVYDDFESLTADDIATTVHWCATLPDRVNVNRLEVMPVMQSFAGFAVKRG